MKKVVIDNAEIFIVPNRTSTMGWYRRQHAMLEKEVTNLANINNVVIDDYDPVIDTWIVIPGLTENLGDHGISLTIDGTDLYMHVETTCIPKSMLPKKEGESTVITFLARDFSKDTTVELCLTLTAAQRKYRYRSFGTFEEVLKKVS